MAGFLIFSDKTQGNILNNFPAVRFIPLSSPLLLINVLLFKDNTFINVARFAFGLNMFTTLPLELFVCREASIYLPNQPKNTCSLCFDR